MYVVVFSQVKRACFNFSPMIHIVWAETSEKIIRDALMLFGPGSSPYGRYPMLTLNQFRDVSNCRAFKDDIDLLTVYAIPFTPTVALDDRGKPIISLVR